MPGGRTEDGHRYSPERLTSRGGPAGPGRGPRPLIGWSGAVRRLVTGWSGAVGPFTGWSGAIPGLFIGRRRAVPGLVSLEVSGGGPRARTGIALSACGAGGISLGLIPGVVSRGAHGRNGGDISPGSSSNRRRLDGRRRWFEYVGSVQTAGSGPRLLDLLLDRPLGQHVLAQIPTSLGDRFMRADQVCGAHALDVDALGDGGAAFLRGSCSPETRLRERTVDGVDVALADVDPLFDAGAFERLVGEVFVQGSAAR